jgi:hypothetical protein
MEKASALAAHGNSLLLQMDYVIIAQPIAKDVILKINVPNAIGGIMFHQMANVSPALITVINAMEKECALHVHIDIIWTTVIIVITAQNIVKNAIERENA